MKKHILVISQYFYPEHFRINDICIEWINRGYKVTVLTGIPNYPEGKFYKGYGLFKKRKEKYKEIDIIRLPLIPRGNNPIMLALNYMSFVFSGFIWKVFSRIKPDYVFIFEVSPMTQALPGIWIAKKRRIPCYIYVQDLWPENVEIVTGIKNKTIINLIGKMVDYIYKNSNKIFTTSKSFIKSIEKRGIPIEKLIYWPQYAEDFYRPTLKTEVKEIPLDNTFNIIYTGNIGKAQGLDILPETAKILKNKYKNIKVRFNIVGEGRYKENLIKNIQNKKIEDMFNFIPKQPPNKIPEYLSFCDVAFLSLSSNIIFSMTIPAKLQSYMACGIPILACAQGETMTIIQEANAGYCSMPGDPDKLAENIVKMVNTPIEHIQQMGENALRYYNKNFNKDILLDQIDEYFNI